MRLSRADANAAESMSIENQLVIIHQSGAEHVGTTVYAKIYAGLTVMN